VGSLKRPTQAWGAAPPRGCRVTPRIRWSIRHSRSL